MVLGLDGLKALDVQIVLNTSIMPQQIKNLINDCSRCSGGMKIPPVSLETSSTPIFCKARPVSFGLKAAVKGALDSMVADGIIQPVAASVWATPIVTPLKANGTVRVCGDFRVSVNPLIKQTAVTTPAVDDMFEGMSGCQIFSKIDLTNAFLQIPLEESSKELTTINTIWGLFQFNFLPFGLTVSPGIFQQQLDRCISDLKGVRAFQDDIVVFAKDKQQHDEYLMELLKVLKRFNIKINATKSVFGVRKIRYLGYYLDGRGISPDVERIRAVKDAPKPTSVAELRSFLGFVQYYSKFVPHFAKLARPLFDLLADGSSFTWTEEEDAAYNALLEATINGKILASFQLGQYSELVVDASEYAIGGVLEQQGRPVICISRKLSVSERNYSQTQKEALAVIWCTKRLHKYLYGTRFKIVTDHQALQHIFRPSSLLGKAKSAMLQRWALSLGAYNYDIEHRKGLQIPQADYMSRGAFHEEPGADVEDVEVYFVDPLPIVRNQLIEETKLAYGSVIASVRNGWSTSARKRFPEIFNHRKELHLEADGVLKVMDKPLIPPTCRRAILDHLHNGHLGREKMRSLAKLICWWPSINMDIAAFVRACERCHLKTNTHPTWKPWPVPFEAMQRIHADYCGPILDRYYILVVLDAYSKYPEAFITTSATAEFTREALQKMFAREGIAQVIVTDNGRHFTDSALQAWLKSIGCYSIFTAPRHPCSNGQAENFVGTLKTAIRTCKPTNLKELNRIVDNFLLQYRNAVHTSTRKSPAMLFKGRNLRMANLDTTEVLFYRGNDTRPCDGLVVGHKGARMFHILDRADGSVHVRHRDQVHISTSSPTLPVVQEESRDSETIGVSSGVPAIPDSNDMVSPEDEAPRTSPTPSPNASPSTPEV